MAELEFIDTHAHLDDPKYDTDRNEVIERALAAGVKRIITVGCWSKEAGFKPVTDILDKYPFVYAALGVHPHDAKDAVDPVPFEQIKKLATDKRYSGRIVAVGEAGLDYHYDNSPREVQREVFRIEINLARELNLPLIVHTREAEKDTMEILKDEGAGEIGGVFHCFSGSLEMAKEALGMGFLLSFTGVVTFPKAEGLREVVKKVPVEKMLIETDCPYLAPVPQRGKRNEPAFVVNTAKAVAKTKALSIEDVARITTLNAEDLFGLNGRTREEKEPMIAYKIRNSLYLNITNRCTNYCTFCAKFKSYTVKGHYLRLSEEPDFDAVIKAVGPDPTVYDEIVFCGFGEPLIRLDLIKQVGNYLKRQGCKIRIDTDGLANLLHGRNVLPELMFADTLSVSLNAPDSETFQKLIKTPFGENAYPAILYFLREAKKHVHKVIASVVSVPGLDIEACRKVAEDDIGVLFRVREYNTVG
jgi:TatD DNase family protein